MARKFTKYPSNYVRAAWYDPEDPNWTIEDERSPYFNESRYVNWTSEDWAYYLGSLLGLGYYDFTMLRDDLNNLRGYEWVEDAETVLDADKLLAFKRFVHYYDKDNDVSYGYDEDEL